MVPFYIHFVEVVDLECEYKYFEMSVIYIERECQNFLGVYDEYDINVISI